MGLTQKYKQQQQQIRVMTNESNYIKGMYFTDAPLAEGYSRVLVNYDIDSMSGKLTPRKGLQSLGVVRPDGKAAQLLNNSRGFNVVAQSKVCSASDSVDPRKVNRYLQSILYNTDTRTLLTATCAAELSENTTFKAEPFSLDSEDEYIAPEPFVIEKPGIHNKDCLHNNFFKKPVGTFAFGNSFYTFLRHNKYAAQKLKELPNAEITNGQGEIIQNWAELKAIPKYSTGGVPGSYYVFISGESIGIIAYYDTRGVLQIWERSEEALLRESFVDRNETNSLCYTKIGSELYTVAGVDEDGHEIRVPTEDVLLDPDIIIDEIDPDQFYVCIINPKKINPTEASSWGYNMLLEDPYDFVCEETAVNLVTILGILPYNKDGNITLTPRKNQEITLKAFYRAPKAFHSDAQNARFYATAKQKITVLTEETRPKEEADGTFRDTAGHVIHYGYVITKTSTGSNAATIQRYYYEDESAPEGVVIVDESALVTETISIEESRDPKTKAELLSNLKLADADPIIYSGDLPFGAWWYCSDEPQDPNKPEGAKGVYFMVMPNKSLTEKKIARFGITQPAASEKLNALTKDEENEIRVRWQMRTSGAADWVDLYNEKFKLSDYYARQGDFAPFIITTTVPDAEVIVKLTITDPSDIEGNEEYVLSTNTIGLSLVSDELANTLNLDAKNFDLGKCTGMCEWEQRLVLWGVPGALNTLFVSDINNPGFFPYPNNVDIFTDPIIAVHNYGNELLVLTTTALYRLIWDAEGTGWTHKLVQQNLHITEQDTYMSCVIKNMFFFKSGEYYYMMVPKVTSAAAVRGEVAIAPISKPIEDLLDNFHIEIYNLIKVMVDQPDLPNFTDKLVNYFSYVDNTKVVVNYIYALDNSTAEMLVQNTEKSKYLYVQLIYDTDARTWTIRSFEAPHMLYASHADAIQQDRFIDLTPALTRDALVLQYYKLQNLKDTTVQYIDTDNGYALSVPIIKNYQYLDTGNREINTELKKRFREFQFKLKNNTATNLGFFTSFLVDGSLRKDLQHYSPRLISDDVSREATIVVERVLDYKTMAYKTTRIERILVPERMLQDNGELSPTTLAEETDPDRWILNQSAFPGRTLWKVRMPISGKGYAPRAILLSTNEADYELLGDAWVYRTQNGR